MENTHWSEKKPKHKIHWYFLLEEEPEVLHIIRSGFDDRYFYFFEDAYELEPWRSGISYGTKKQIEELFNIKLDE